MKIPKKLQPVLWSVDVNRLDMEKDKYYIIHQIFAYGGMKDIFWVLQNYSKREIVEVFKQGFKDYRRPRFYFIKDALLRLEDWHPDERYYVKNIPRVVR